MRLGNGNSSQEWTGTVRLLRQQDLQGMTNVRYAEVGRTEAVEPNGKHAVSIPPGQSALYKITGDVLQIGVMVIEPGRSKIEDLVPSFYY